MKHNNFRFRFFRLWNKKDKTMEAVMSIERDDPIKDDDSLEEADYIACLDQRFRISTDVQAWYEEGGKSFVLMESTGMKDCKGNEIFEGDILYVRYREQDYGGKVFHHQVIWNTKEGMWGTNGGMGYENGSLARHLEMYFCLVAGNIYQDKDLTRLLRR